MATPTDIIAGTVTLTNGSTDIVGVGTSWSEDDLRNGDLFVFVDGGDGFQLPIIDTITDNLNGTIIEPWTGPTLTGVEYRIRYQWDSSRVSAQARAMVQKLGNGNVEALAALTGPGVPVFNGPHSMAIKPETDFINGVAFDVQVDTLPDRDAYDGQSAGFAVLVADVGDGRSAIYSKNSNTSGDWSDPAYITGPEGDMPNLVIQPTVTGAPGTDADVDFDPISGGYEVTFTIPAGEGFAFVPGGYSGATAYVKGDVVRDNGSSWIALQPTIGNAPPTLPTTSNAYWELMAERGTDGDIDGVTPFWQGRITVDASQSEALSGLGAQPALGFTPANKAGDQFLGNVGFGVAPVAGRGILQVAPTVTPGAPQTSGSNDAAQLAVLGGAAAGVRVGVRPSGEIWLQNSLLYDYSSNQDISLNPNGGQVLVPQRVQFHASKAGSSPAGVIAGYGAPSFNIGAAFNAATGIFTAPKTGLYAFSASQSNQAAGGNFRLNVGKNGGAFPLAAFTNAVSEVVHLGWTMRLVAGDYCYVWIEIGTSGVTVAGYNFFSGYLIG